VTSLAATPRYPRSMIVAGRRAPGPLRLGGRGPGRHRSGWPGAGRGAGGWAAGLGGLTRAR
jgi:hypothetical protein